MKKVIVRSHLDWSSPVWYRALSLTERSVSASQGAHENSTETIDGEARRRLQDWKEQAPFPTGEYFEQRLAMDAITEDDLLKMLAETADNLQSRLAGKEKPEWFDYLIDAFENRVQHNISFSSTLSPQASLFMQVAMPVIQKGVTRLCAGIQALVQTYSDLPFDEKTILPLLVAHLPARLLPKLIKTLVLELNIARIQGRLQGETPEERFQYFLDQMMHEDAASAFFEEYVVLARLLVETTDLWVESELELLMRLSHDWQEIKPLFIPDRDPGVLKEIQVGLGDTHRRGRSVSVLVWSDGFRLVYKPRSLNVDMHFQELLRWFNQHGQQPELYLLTILARKTYGWVEYVQPHSCTTHEEVERFYQRQGAYLAILYALAATDFHSENVIAAGEHPVLVDLEALFQPRIRQASGLQDKLPGIEAINQSVLRVGLLPQRIWSNGQAEGIDISGLGGHKGQLSPQPQASWAGLGTDQMQLQRERTEVVVGNHRPRLQGQEIDTVAYCDAIVEGFTSAYRLMMQQRTVFLQELLPGFAYDEIRCIVRPTQVYGILLSNSFHPEILRDALDRDRFFDRLWITVEHQPYLMQCIKAERNDLLAGDIPLFVTTPVSLDLFSSYGDVIAHFFECSGLDVVRQQLQDLDEQNLERQSWIIRASFTSLTLGRDHSSFSNASLPVLQPHAVTVAPDQLLSEARAVGDRLCLLALRSGRAASWLGVTAINEREWHLLPTDADLYDGVAGIALFLAYLGHLAGEERYTAMAQAALETTRMLVRRQREIGIPCMIGGFNGLGSYIYLLAHLGTLWDDTTLYQEAETIAYGLVKDIPRDRSYDVIGGAAGCIAALLGLYAVRPMPDTMQIALQCGDHLLATAQSMSVGIGWSDQEEVPLTGCAHGSAGIALNLLRLFAVSGEERFRQAGLAALAYERSLFLPERGNWPDLRKSLASKTSEQTSDTEKRDACMVAWCHGAPGIGLARLGMLHILDDSDVRAEIDIALRTTLTAGFGSNHSLCHGDLGNLDILLTASQTLPQQGYQDNVEHLSARLVHSIQKLGWITGVPRGIETPGLMVGITGIGYALLRLAAPLCVPSVLLLAPPDSQKASKR